MVINLIRIIDEGCCFILYDDEMILGKCYYDKNEVLKLEGELIPLLRTALVKSVLSKIEKQGYEKAHTELDLSDLGFKNGELNLIGYFKCCGE